MLSTKVGRLLVPDPGGKNLRDVEGNFDVPAVTRRQFDFSADGVRRSIEESLERLGLDRIDIAYLHDPDDHGPQAIDEALPAEFIRRHDIDLVMLAGRYTLLDQSSLADLMPLATVRGVGIVIAGVYNSGLLEKPRPASDAKYDYEAAPVQLLNRANAIADVCERFGVTLPDAAIVFALRHPAVVSVVVGARTAQQVQGSVDRYRTDVPEALWDALRAAGLIHG